MLISWSEVIKKEGCFPQVNYVTSACAPRGNERPQTLTFKRTKREEKLRWRDLHMLLFLINTWLVINDSFFFAMRIGHIIKSVSFMFLLLM